MRSIRQEPVATLADLEKLKPEDRWVVYVEEEEADYLYDGEKSCWVEIMSSNKKDEPPPVVRYDEDDRIASNKLMFDTLNLNSLAVTIGMVVAIVFAIVYGASDVASVLGGTLASQGATIISNGINKMTKK